MVATYRLESRQADGTYIASLPAANLQGEWFLNKADNLRFDLPIHHPNVSSDTIYAGRDEVWLYRNDVLVFAGPVWDMTASSDSGKWTCSAASLESYFEHRRIDWDYNVQMQGGLLAWDLMEDSQAQTNGQLYITKGTVPTTEVVAMTTTRAAGDIIFGVVSKLAESDNGFDWEINSATREFNVWSPRRDTFARSGLWFDKDRGSVNVKSYSLQIMGSYLANDVLISNNEKYGTASSPASQAIYGLRQYKDTNNDAQTVFQLTMDAQYTRNLRMQPKLVPGVVVDGNVVNPFEGDIWYGDRTPVFIRDGSVYFNKDMRCIGFQATISKHGSETFVIYLNDLREVDPGAELS